MKKLLIRHSRFHATESILGFLLRLTEENGYSSPEDVRRAAGITRGSIAKAENIAKLALATNHSFREASEMGEVPEAEGRILVEPYDQEWLPGQESTAAGKCCSRCVEEIGYIQAHWVLPLMYACPVHNVFALTACPSCHRPLWWYRPGLLECGCGQRISSASQSALSPNERTLLDVLRRKMLNLPWDNDNPGSLPVENLMAMDLKMLVRTIETLARLQGGNLQTPKGEVVSLAARILSDWPRGFLTFLDPGNSASHFAEHRTHLNRIYNAICGWSDDQRHATAFIGALIVEFAIIRWGYRHPRLLLYSDSLPTGLVDCSLVFRDAALIGKSETRGIGHRGMRKAQFTVRRASPSMISGAFRAGEQVLSGAAAADCLGIPEQVLRALKQNEILAVQNSPEGGWGYHRQDVDRLANALLARSPQSSPSSPGLNDVITLRAAMAWEELSVSSRASLIRSVLGGEVKVERRSGNHVGDLLISRQAVRAFASPASKGQEIRTALQVARLLGCPEAAIPGLTRMGMLRGTTGVDGWKFEANSVEAFRLEYKFLLALAKEEQTTRNWLTKLCRMNRIGLLWTRSPKDTGKQPFIRLKDVEVLRSVVTKVRLARERRRVDLHTTLGAASSAASY